jgi:quercetin dioxygenase-like cupin family protein
MCEASVITISVQGSISAGESFFIVIFGFATAMHAQQVNTLLTKQLPEAPGKEIEVITVSYAPGAVDAIHRHDAHAVVYVLDGEVEMQVRGGTLRRLGPGQVFYESPGRSKLGELAAETPRDCTGFCTDRLHLALTAAYCR